MDNTHFSVKFYVRGSVHLNSRLKKSNEMQQYADAYLLRNYSTCFGRQSCPSSGVYKTSCSLWYRSYYMASRLPQTWPNSPHLVTFEEACSQDSMIWTRGCNSRFMHSWWWGRWTPETCNLAVNKYLHTAASRWIFST